MEPWAQGSDGEISPVQSVKARVISNSTDLDPAAYN